MYASANPIKKITEIIKIKFYKKKIFKTFLDSLGGMLQFFVHI